MPNPSDAAQRFAELFDAVPVGLYRTTPDGRILEANLAMVSLLGCSERDELLATNATDFYVDPAARRSIKSELAAAGAVRDFEAELRRRDGRHIWVRINAKAVRHSEKLTLIEGVMEDVTERRRAEVALRDSEERLRHAQKMEAIGRLAGGVAHDFNNLLTAIIGYSTLLEEDDGLDGPARESAGEIRAAAERAASLTSQLLAVSRRQMLTPELLDLNAVIASTVPLLRRLIGEDIELVTSLAPDAGHVRADRTQLEQVIYNLVLNARDAMARGGRLAIDTFAVAVDAGPAATQLGLAPGPYAMMEVSDEGSGMSDDVRARIFDPYFTTKPTGKGTGLGLSTVYGIVQQSGGLVTCRSGLGRGTTMSVYLQREAAAPAAAMIRTPAPQSGRETILVVEDEEAVRTFVVRALTGQGYNVLSAADAERAEALAVAHEGIIELLLTDVVMPGMGGGELAERIQAARPGISVLYMSGYTGETIGRHGVADNGAFLQKPFSPDTLAAKVRAVLDRQN